MHTVTIKRAVRVNGDLNAAVLNYDTKNIFY